MITCKAHLTLVKELAKSPSAGKNLRVATINLQICLLEKANRILAGDGAVTDPRIEQNKGTLRDLRQRRTGIQNSTNVFPMPSADKLKDLADSIDQLETAAAQSEAGEGFATALIAFSNAAGPVFA